MLLKSKKVAYLGVLLGLNQIFIILSSVIETNTMILMMVASLLVGVVIIEFGTRSGITFYVASCVLGFFLTFNKVEIMTYILFFGLYSIVKHLVECKVHNKVIEYSIKILCFNILLIVLYCVVKMLISIKIVWWMVIGAELLFLIYDYTFTVFINYYMDKIRLKLKL